MALASPSVSALMQKTLNRSATIARMKFKLKPQQVQNILLAYLQESRGPYNDLIEILETYPLNDENFKYLFDDCISCVVLLGRNMKRFVSIVCNVEWISKSEENIELFSRFTVDLLTAHSYHAFTVMASLINKFKEDGENWEKSPAEDLIQKWSHIHSLIAQIIAVMPMCSDILMQTIIDKFPYYKSSVYVNRAFVYNLIWITKYIPLLREPIITAIVNRMVIMDVNIEDQSKTKAHNDTIFPMEVDVTDSGLVGSLDFCMLEVLNWLQDEREEALPIMCNIFERIILPTYGVRSVQFLILYTISISQQCADRILKNLWTITSGLHGLGLAALVTRRTAASHLAGLLARCVRVPNSRLYHYLKSMADWCHSYITATQESTTLLESVKVNGAFLAICHAIFYLIAYKHQQLFDSKESIHFVESLNLPRLVTCSLNPLKTCPPQVTRAFSSVTRSHQLVYCQALIEKNLRQTLVSTAKEDFEEWFPYDPFMLPRSGQIIWPLCTEYKDWSQNGDDESQYSTRVTKLETEEDDFLMGTSSGRRVSCLSNCISPGFKST